MEYCDLGSLDTAISDGRFTNLVCCPVPHCISWAWSGMCPLSHLHLKQMAMHCYYIPVAIAQLAIIPPQGTRGSRTLKPAMSRMHMLLLAEHTGRLLALDQSVPAIRGCAKLGLVLC